MRNYDYNLFYVYEHWIDDECIYVGSGKGRRAWNFYDYQRNDEWLKRTKGKIDLINVNILKICDDEISARFYENIYTRIRMKHYNLTNKMISTIPARGDKHWTKANGLSNETKKKISNALIGRNGNKHTDETKKIIGLKNSGKNNGMYGKIPNNSKRLLVNYNGEEMIFETVSHCEKYFKGIISIKTIRNLIEGKNSNKAKKLNIKIKLMDELPEKGKTL